MKYQIIITDKANEQLHEIIMYLSDESNFSLQYPNDVASKIISQNQESLIIKGPYIHKTNDRVCASKVASVSKKRLVDALIPN